MNDKVTPPHRLILERWHAARAAAHRAQTALAATRAIAPIHAHAERARQLPPEQWEKHLKARGIDRY